MGRAGRTGRGIKGWEDHGWALSTSYLEFWLICLFFFLLFTINCLQILVSLVLPELSLWGECPHERESLR